MSKSLKLTKPPNRELPFHSAQANPNRVFEKTPNSDPRSPSAGIVGSSRETSSDDCLKLPYSLGSVCASLERQEYPVTNLFFPLFLSTRGNASIWYERKSKRASSIWVSGSSAGHVLLNTYGRASVRFNCYAFHFQHEPIHFAVRCFLCSKDFGTAPFLSTGFISVIKNNGFEGWPLNFVSE